MPANPKILSDEKQKLKTKPFLLNLSQRAIVELAVREVCDHRKYVLHAVNARSNHVHSVVNAACNPEKVMNAFKTYATRRLREAHLLSNNIKPWARHGSTRWLWTEEQVGRAMNYVINGQGDEPFL